MVYCDMILQGAKPIADIMFRKEHVDMVRDIVVKTYGLDIRIDSSPGAGFLAGIIYRDPIHLAIHDICGMYFDEKYPLHENGGPRIFITYVMGKLFGYSDAVILGYIRKHFDPDKVIDSLVLE